jgi:hypothetical protein
MQLLPDLGALEGEQADEQDAEHGQQDLLLLLLCLEQVDGPPGHYGAPVADALLEGVSLVVVVSVVAGAVVDAGGVAAGTEVGAAA